MIKGGKTSVLTYAEKCKNILASNWQGYLNTVKADANGSKGEIYTSKVRYFVKRGKPYIWVPENDMHNVNTMIDERGSFAVTSPFPGPLPSFLKSIKKLPARVALMGEVLPLKNEKARLPGESLKEVISSERSMIEKYSYSVLGILSSSSLGATCRGDNLQELLESDKRYVVFKFNPSSYTYFDSNGGTHELDLEEVHATKPDPLSSHTMSLIDGINQSEVRRRALILFCITHLNKNAKKRADPWFYVKDAYLLSIDRKGLDVVGKVLGPIRSDGSREYQWRELRIAFREEAHTVETFCRQLVEMEEESLESISNFSGI
ncbi:uncharacterized protein [Solanum lycopersicum]|uniref:uncharacterized protein isoform X1 n=1 Tax=Solanum lycopersicum TaxID=4081 RepID=UPI000532E5A1|nr:uncharacterized protein LOC101260055 isoform X1 [Solanum lycopersicum]